MNKFTFLLTILLGTMVSIFVGCSHPEPTPFPATEPPPVTIPPTEIQATSAPLEEAPTQVPPTASTPTELPPTPTPPPTLMPSPRPTVDNSPDPRLFNSTWQWQSLESSVLDINIANPEKYLIQFKEDGSIELQADCNLLQAAYTVADNQLNIDLTPTSAAALLAECPDGAMYELFLLALDTTTEFLFLDQNLVLFVGKEGNVMRFIEAGSQAIQIDAESEATPASQPTQSTPPANTNPTGIVNAPDGINLRKGPGTEYPTLTIIANGTALNIIGISQDREWWLIDAPEQPDGQGWVSRNFVETELGSRDVPTVVAPEREPTLLDHPWQWQSLTGSAESLTVDDPSLYTLEFFDDGTAVFRADCHTATTTYTSSETAISINMAAITFVACPGDSLDDTYLTNLANVTTYTFEAGSLLLQTPTDGTLRFSDDQPPISSVPTETPAPTSPEAAGDFYKVVSFGFIGEEQALLAGSEITVILTDTTIKGNAGCNDYSGSLTRTADSFTVHDLLVTERTCTEPAGIMAQEQAFLTALENTGAFSWEERLSDDGSSIVTASQLFYVTNRSGVINILTP